MAIRGYQHGKEQIWIGDMEFTVPLRITQEDKNGIKPKWSPDDNWLAFLGQDGGRSTHYDLEIFNLTKN